MRQFESFMVVAYHAGDLGVGAAHEWDLACDHFPKDDSERVNVGLLGVFLTAEDFRGHPMGSADFPVVVDLEFLLVA